MNILFVDHYYHINTKSSLFFQEMLSKFGKLIVLDIDPLDETNYITKFEKMPFSDIELVVLWQIDFLAPFFINRGIPTVVVPLYDASANFDEIHWKAMQGSLIVSFSLALYNTIALSNTNVIYVKYFPEKDLEISINHETPIRKSGISAFFWERKPSQLSAKMVLKRIKGLNHLHIHNYPDPGELSSKPDYRNDIKITYSDFFSSRKEYLQTVSQSDIFIAPRFSEGIGFGFLEAMAMGIPVIAHHLPTHSEYINNWKNGILIDFANQSMICNVTSESIEKMKMRLSIDKINFRNNWLNFYKPLLLSKIEEYFENTRKTILKKNKIVELEKLFLAHIDTKKYYNYLANYLL